MTHLYDTRVGEGDKTEQNENILGDKDPEHSSGQEMRSRFKYLVGRETSLMCKVVVAKGMESNAGNKVWKPSNVK